MPTYHKLKHRTVVEEDEDWILLDNDLTDEENREHQDSNKHVRQSGGWSLFLTSHLGVVAQIKKQSAHNRQTLRQQEQRLRNQMALGESDVKLIRASWDPARDDPTGAGVLLFKG